MSEPEPPEEPDEPPVPATAPVPKKPTVLKWQDSDWESAWEVENPEGTEDPEREFEIALQESQEVVRKRSFKSSASAASFQSDASAAPRLYKPPTWMRRLLTSKIFLMSNVCIILLNMIWTGFYVNSLVTRNDDSVEAASTNFNAFFVVESIFSGCFLAELIVRLAHFASLRLWHDPWLCFDIVVIVIPPMELWVLRPLGWESGSTTVTVVNIFRVFRVSRGVALLASINWFRPMYLAAVGFKHSINSLLVVAIYIGTLLFTTSLILCNLLGPSSPDHASLPDFVRGRFRSVGLSYLTLSECLLGGIEWGPELVDQLLQEMVFAGLVLLVFLILGSLLWLNTVAGIFMQQVDRSFEVTDVNQFKDPEFVAATKEILRDFVLDLKDSDQDNSQSLSWRQICLVVTQHLELLSDVGIRMPEAKRIFSELDMNNTGYVSIPMFIQRLIENLKYKTLETLIFENQQSRLLSLMKKLARLNIRSSKKVMEQLKGMSTSIAQVESEEPLQSAVQRRLARQKQRVAFERDQFNEAMASNDFDLTKDQKSVSAASVMSAEGVHQDHDGHSFVIDGWKRAVEEQRRNIRALVNPMCQL